MISAKFLNLFNLFYLLAFLSGQTYAQTTGSKIGESIKVEFISEQKKITVVEGWRNASWTGEEYYSFRSIPYAEPPIGELRFKDPLPLKQMPAYIDARYEGHDCYSVNPENASEDCLRLNIYTPTNNETANLPVVFFIHGGALYAESGLSSHVAASYMLSKPIVFVTINYRLGALGFLQLGTREIPGNAGLKDQVEALRWVQKHIAHFGGNPQDVTIMGYSVGSMCVGLHLVSPMSQGLFHKAIFMSGSLPMHTPVPKYEQLDFLRRQAQALKCKDAFNAEEILSCLQGASGKQIFDSLQKLFVFAGNPMYQYRVVIENDFGQQRFLIESPLDSMRRGSFAKVPLLIGFNNGELCSFAVDIYKDRTQRRLFHENFEELAPIIFLYDNLKRNVSAITKQLKEYYLPNFTELREEHLAGLCDIFSEVYIRYGAQLIAELAAPHTEVFPYRFDFTGDFSTLDYPITPARVEHNVDCAYLFGSRDSRFKLTSNTKAMIRIYTKFMYDFVKMGSYLRGEIPTYPHGYSRIARMPESQAGTALDLDTFELWKRLFL